MKIRDSVAFVTGANRGIGLVFVQELLAGGARKVYAAARQPEHITLAGVERVRLDVTNPEDVAAAARQCTDVNILINNAGIALRTGFLAPESVEASRSEMETNYYGPLLLSRAFAPVLANLCAELGSDGDVPRLQGSRVGFHQLATDRFRRARYAGGGRARRSGRYGYGARTHPS